MIDENSFIIITLILAGRGLFTAPFFFFCIGKATDSAAGSNGRFRTVLHVVEVEVEVEGKYLASAFASACVGFLIREITLSAVWP